MKVILKLDRNSEGWVNVKCMAINITSSYKEILSRLLIRQEVGQWLG